MGILSNFSYNSGFECYTQIFEASKLRNMLALLKLKIPF